MAAYYNEHDKKAAEWLRELINAGVIAPGEVDERSIEDVLPGELVRFDQCHFFAGIGAWSYALRQAGWPDDRQVWTGSCPCQPFSAAGKGEGIADERHLWPAFFHLIEQCRPRTIFGEQVSSKDGLTWLDIVSSDLEGAGYSIGAADICAAGVGAPHIRQRLYFVAESLGEQKQSPAAGRFHAESGGNGSVGGMADSETSERRRTGGKANGRRRVTEIGGSSTAIELAHPASGNPGTKREQRGGEHRLQPESGGTDELGESKCIGRGRRSNGDSRGSGGEIQTARLGAPGLTNGFWRDAEWLYCRDEKYRPTKSGIFPLVNGTAGRVALLRGAGNAIVSEVAKEWIKTYMEIRG